MTDTSQTTNKMTLPEFEQRLQSTEFFDSETGQISDDPRLQAFLADNPDSAALVRDLQYIAVAAKSLFDSDVDTEPSETVWSNIQTQLKSDLEAPTGPAKSPEAAES
jgi:hypothetical protein